MADDVEQDVAAIAGIAAVDTILEIVCRLTGMGFAAVARVTETRWIAGAVRDNIAFGLMAGSELELATTLCNKIRTHRQAVVIEDVATDADYCGHPTPALYGFQSYISLPIFHPAGVFFGTLCAIDMKPAKFDRPEIIATFRMFAELISLHLEAHDRLAVSAAALDNERRLAALREQFLAVLGHDLRNPLASVAAGIKLLEREGLSARAVMVTKAMQESTSRMGRLIDSVLDLAHGRLGGGIVLDRQDAVQLAPVLMQVVAELQTVWPNRVIETAWHLAQPMNCDPLRIGQVLSNLLGNALTHGRSEGPVGVTAANAGGTLVLTVVNQGEPIPQPVRDQLFQPFVRGTVAPGRGLGLGLYIASEIAEAHGGRIDMTHADGHTRFTMRIPG